jgi:acetylornithine/succinyldiaminopimelate/putrescine aminotransferase
MSSNEAIIQLENRFTSGAYPKRSVAIVRGEGARLWDADGRAYIDCASGQGVALLGHARPEVAAAIAEQAARLITCPEIFYNDQRARLLERLIGLAPAGLTHAFLCNSGAEAVEGAIKFARLATGRPNIVAAMRGFHGRTLGALSATWEKKYREPFEPLVPGFSHVPYDNLERLAAAVDGQTAAVVLEVVQGEGGVRPASREFLLGARAVCDRAGALLIIDEVQTGFGRTGRWFAVQHHDLRPDLMALAKGMAGGVPMGAVLMSDAVAATITQASMARLRRQSAGLHGGVGDAGCVGERGFAAPGGGEGRLSDGPPATHRVAQDPRGARVGPAGRGRSAREIDALPSGVAASRGVGAASGADRHPLPAPSSDQPG